MKVIGDFYTKNYVFFCLAKWFVYTIVVVSNIYLFECLSLILMCSYLVYYVCYIFSVASSGFYHIFYTYDILYKISRVQNKILNLKTPNEFAYSL